MGIRSGRVGLAKSAVTTRPARNSAIIGLAIVSLAVSTGPQSFAQDLQDLRRQLQSDDPVAQFRALSELRTAPELTAELVPEISGLILSAEAAVLRAAIDCLAPLGEHALPVAPSLVQRLDDGDYHRRQVLLEAFVAIGPNVVPLLEEQLHSPSPRVRAVAISGLNRLTTVANDELIRLQQDGDPRVRVAVAEAWGRHGSEGARPLIELLGDPEVPVAVASAKVLSRHRPCPSLVVPALIDRLPQPGVGWMAVQALGSYGVEARQAVPALIENNAAQIALGRPSNNYWVDEALAKIGPPWIKDLDRFRELLSQSHPDSRSCSSTSCINGVNRLATV